MEWAVVWRSGACILPRLVPGASGRQRERGTEGVNSQTVPIEL